MHTCTHAHTQLSFKPEKSPNHSSAENMNFFQEEPDALDVLSTIFHSVSEWTDGGGGENTADY